MTETAEEKQNIVLQELNIPEIRKYTKGSAPLIHCITNPISIHDCANIILAAGARPIMAEHPAEVEEITASASALMLNLGNITDARIESMQRALKEANQRKLPVLLDLVGVTCSSLRRKFAGKLLSDGKFAVIKGNISEILAAADLPFHGTGIDAGSQDAVSKSNEDWYCSTAKRLADHLNCTVMATGKQDLIADRNQAFLISNGDAALSGITGSGCMVGALTAAYLPGSMALTPLKRAEPAVVTPEAIPSEFVLSGDRGKTQDCVFSRAFPGTAAALLAAITMGISGEHAAAVSRGPGSFQTALLDEIFCLTEGDLQKEARIRCIG